MSLSFPKPVIGFAAWSGTGKTTLLRQVLPLLKQHGLRVAMIKHAHHDFDVDIPGKDSYELRHAGASPMIISSRKRTAIVIETPESADPELQDLLNCIAPDQVDLVLVEGFKEAPIAKIELHRASIGKPLLYPNDPHIMAIAHDGLASTPGIPEFNLNQPEQIANFLLRYARQEYKG